MICCSSEDDTSEEEPFYSTILSVRRRHVKTRIIDTVNEVELVPHVEEVPEIHTCMYYIGGAITNFPFHIGVEQLSSTSFPCTGEPKIWYTIPSSNQTAFKDFVASQIIDHEYLKDPHGCVRQIIAMNNILFKQAVLTASQHQKTVRRFFEREGRFAILAPKVSRWFQHRT